MAAVPGRSIAEVVAGAPAGVGMMPPVRLSEAAQNIAAIRDRGGWIGLNLYGRFLAHDRRATLDDCVAQTMHVARIAGFDRVGLGSDLDGGFGRAELPTEIQSPTDYARLLDGLERAGFMASGGTRAGFAHGNLGRVVDSSGCLI